jgi:beta-alanine degradation protein BauB
MHKVILGLLLFCISHATPADNTAASKRIPQFTNDKVTVWKTIIYPGNEKILKLHRHENDRILVALTNGVLKIVSNTGKINYLKLEKEKAYYLKKDIPGELHTDENEGSEPIAVIVMEFKS